MRRLARIHLKPSHSTTATACITVAATALAALVAIALPGGFRQGFQGADAAAIAAKARSVTSPTARPAASAAGQVQAEVPTRPLIVSELAVKRRIAAKRRAEARAAARAAAAQQAYSPPASQPVASPAPAAPAAGYYSYAALEQLWMSAGGPSWAAAQAASIAECESGGNPQAYNPSGASGLWQILGEVVPGNIFDPMVNAENAVAKFRDSGDTFAQWVC